MQAIDRSEKLEILNQTTRSVPDLFLTQRVAERDGLFARGETGSHHLAVLQSGQSTDGRLYDFERWLYNADEADRLLGEDATLDEILPAYATAIKQEHSRVADFAAGLSSKLGARLEHLADTGHLPSSLSERFQTMNFSARLRIGIADSSIDQKAGAFYWPAQHAMYFRPWTSKKQLASAFTHESLHALSGTTTLKDGSGKLFSSRLGLGMDPVGESGYIVKSMARHRAINEGVTEYLNNLLIHGLHGAVSRHNRGKDKDTGHYVAEREIVQIIADRVGIDTILEAYAEDYRPGQAGTLTHTRDFVRAIRRAYGPGFLQKLDKLDSQDGPQRALEFMKAADYLAGNEQCRRKTGHKLVGILKRKAS